MLEVGVSLTSMWTRRAAIEVMEAGMNGGSRGDTPSADPPCPISGPHPGEMRGGLDMSASKSSDSWLSLEKLTPTDFELLASVSCAEAKQP